MYHMEKFFLGNIKGVNMGSKYHVMQACDEKYLQNTIISINSVSECNAEYTIEFHILCAFIDIEIEERLKKWLKDKNEKHEIIFHHINPSNYVFPVKKGDAVTAETYFRIIAPDILIDVDKVLYLDGDTVTIGDLRELFELDLTDCPVAAALGAAPDERKIMLGMRPEDPYFQAGVMLINLVYWRNNNLSDQILDFIKLNADVLPRWDQDALNAILHNKFKVIDMKYNCTLSNRKKEYLIEHPSLILHYTGWGNHKPWYKNTVSDFADYYLHAKDGTPYKNESLAYYIEHEFPKALFDSSENIILYAAGTVGKSYYKQNEENGYCNIVAWADKNFGYKINGHKVISIDEAIQLDYDYVLIAVGRECDADEIRGELIKKGVGKDKIIWKEDNN